jgi:hypothetical protein
MKFAVRKPYSKYRILADGDQSAVQNPQKMLKEHIACKSYMRPQKIVSNCGIEKPI